MIVYIKINGRLIYTVYKFIPVFGLRCNVLVINIKKSSKWLQIKKNLYTFAQIKRPFNLMH